MGACLPTQTDGLIRLTLATLAADDHGDINVKLANVSNLNQCCEPTPWVESVGECLSSLRQGFGSPH